MGYHFELEGRSAVVLPIYRPGGGGFDLEIDGRRVAASLTPRGGGEYELEIEGRCERLWLARRGDTLYLQVGGRVFRARAQNALDLAARAAEREGADASVVAPMPGVVVQLAVRVGDRVREGDLLLTIESMKLETPIAATRGGAVAEICYGVGESFERGAALLRFAVEAAPTSGESGAQGGDAP